MEEFDEQEQLEAFRKAVSKRIIAESDRLVDEIFGIIYDAETDNKVKLSAIGILMDRALPKLGVQHTKEEEVEERGSRKQIREEIEKLLLNEEDDEEEE